MDLEDSELSDSDCEEEFILVPSPDGRGYHMVPICRHIRERDPEPEPPVTIWEKISYIYEQTAEDHEYRPIRATVTLAVCIFMLFEYVVECVHNVWMSPRLNFVRTSTIYKVSFTFTSIVLSQSICLVKLIFSWTIGPIVTPAFFLFIKLVSWGVICIVCLLIWIWIILYDITNYIWNTCGFKRLKSPTNLLRDIGQNLWNLCSFVVTFIVCFILWICCLLYDIVKYIWNTSVSGLKYLKSPTSLLLKDIPNLALIVLKLPITLSYAIFENRSSKTCFNLACLSLYGLQLQLN